MQNWEQEMWKQMWEHVLNEYDLFYIKFQHRTEFNNYTIIFYEYNFFS